MKVLVCGGRDYGDVEALFAFLDALDPRPTLIIQGGNKGVWHGDTHMPGADLIALRWATARGIPCDEYAVDLSVDGPWPAAGPIRNKRMLWVSRPDLVVAAPGGRGTADMVRRAKAAGVPVKEIAL